LLARAQQPERLRRIGILRFTNQDQAVINSLLRGLQMLGYVDGRNVAIEYRDAEGNYEQFSNEVSELVRINPDVIFSFGGEQAPVVKAATSSIPIVVVVSNDPVESGLVASLARPGGNITGVTYVHDMLAGKSVELLKDTAPWVSRVAILWNPRHVDPSFERHSAPHACWMCNFNRSRCGRRAILRAHSKPQCASGPKPLSLSDRGSCS
jgi:putative ABC transport system substrate-binding protein